MSKQKPHKSKRKTYGNNSPMCSKALGYCTAKTQNSRHILNRFKTCITTVTILVILKTIMAGHRLPCWQHRQLGISKQEGKILLNKLNM